jgi:hypothetical protein
MDSKDLAKEIKSIEQLIETVAWWAVQNAIETTNDLASGAATDPDENIFRSPEDIINCAQCWIADVLAGDMTERDVAEEIEHIIKSRKMVCTVEYKLV